MIIIDRLKATLYPQKKSYILYLQQAGWGVKLLDGAGIED